MWTRPVRRGRSNQALAHKGVNLLADDFTLLTSHANKGVLSSPRPIGHDWVYSGSTLGAAMKGLNKSRDPSRPGMTESGGSLVVRTALVADAPSIAAIGRVAFPAVHDDVIGTEFAATMVEQTYSVEVLTDCITRCSTADDAEFLVAERDGEVIGYLHYDSEGAEPELHRVYVDPGQKRGGIGSALMRELHARLPRDGEYILLVVEANKDAQAFTSVTAS